MTHEELLEEEEETGHSLDETIIFIKQTISALECFIPSISNPINKETWINLILASEYRHLDILEGRIEGATITQNVIDLAYKSAKMTGDEMPFTLVAI